MPAISTKVRKLHGNQSPPKVSPISPIGSVAAVLQGSRDATPRARVSPIAGVSPQNASLKALSYTLIGLNGMQQQKKIAELTIQDDLTELNNQLTRSWAGNEENRSDTPEGAGDAGPLTPVSRKAAEQRKELDGMLSESASMTAGIDALLNKLSAKRNRPNNVGSRSHRRQLSRSLPDLRVAVEREASRTLLGQSDTIHEDREFGTEGLRTMNSFSSLSKALGHLNKFSGKAKTQSNRQFRRATQPTSGGPRAKVLRSHTSMSDVKRSSNRSLVNQTTDFMESLRSSGSSNAVKSAARRVQRKKDLCYGVCSLAGADNKSRNQRGSRRKTNQDAHLIVEGFPEPGATLFAVFDGHGPHGQKCSALCASQFVQCLKKSHFGEGGMSWSTKDVRPIVTKAFTSLQRALHRASFDTTLSGTTAAACVTIPRLHKLVTINCGDSNICLGSLFDSKAQESGRMQHQRQRSLSEGDGGDVINLSDFAVDERSSPRKPSPNNTLPQFRVKFAFKPHVPTNPRERARIEGAGGFVFRLEGDTDRVWGVDPEEEDVDDRSGLAMSRSLGDEDLHLCGVTSDPEVRVQDLSYPRDQFIVLASDGVWDHINEFDIKSLITEAQGHAINHSDESVAGPQRRGGKKQSKDQRRRERKNSTDSSDGDAAAEADKNTARKSTPHWNAQVAAQTLCDSAREEWVKRKRRIDDVTAIVVNLVAIMAP
mmetsp:Transcript_39476/g.57993  ORF Transcript_39476/g.57993 Transcript_39476/m.57993 type:complete len:710 (+) Transcript_39476:142-2271(+)|eukprot:CAMPEP_0195517972 /NCGR_PEP_ID=MMETSP0794_2-20130614/11851_1 /TAXON_ID=515487 /ORGANISM="Stephanopyxis turris, Strain CCMP 815" /LENGTH=709 /DNA_ID=CAMNT_0040646861 /DNA_START=141 /DNA_END=2270 /DNA_ORIENTATION=-